MQTKSQSAIEFVTLVALMTVALVGFYAVTTSKTIDAKEEENRKIAEDIADFAYKEIELARSVGEGYSRVFNMPQAVNGINYDISIIDNRELVVNYLGYEYVRLLPSNVTGNISQGPILIFKRNGVVYINSIYKELPPTATSLSIFGADFKDNGNIVLKGRLFQYREKILNTGNDEFIIKDDNGNNILLISLITGDMLLKGRVYENQVSLNPSLAESYFIVKDAKGSVVTYVDSLGNIHTKGKITQKAST